MGYVFDYITSEFDTKVEYLPIGCYIIQREIKKALSGLQFFINDEETRKPVDCEAVPANVYNYYFDLWENFHFFKSTPNAHWGNERKWLIDFLKSFERTRISVENYRIELESRKR